MKTRCLGGLLASIAAPLCAQQTPNVVVIVADDLGYGDLSCYGATSVSTPNVDRLAASGVRFTNAHACASTSTPARYSLLTGEYCFRRHGTDIATGDAGMIIRPEQVTVADIFRQSGYATAAIGKWHLGLGSRTGAQDWNGSLDMTPKDIGFSYHYLMAATADRVPCVFIEDGSVVNHDPEAPISVSYAANFPGEPTGAANPELLTKLKSSHGHNQSIVNGIGRIGYMKGGGRALWRDEDIADSIATAAIRFIGENREQPFFMYLCTNDVHVPRMPHERFRGKSALGLRGEAIMQFDETVGSVVQALHDNGLTDNTLIILTSDNGPVLDDGYQDQAATLNGSHRPWGPWRGGKYSAFEAGTRVPFIVCWPGTVTGGTTSAALVSQIDLMAAAAALTGTAIPHGAGIDSQDHLDTWLGRNSDDRPYVAEMAANRTLSLVSGQWKYIEPSNGAAKIGTVNIETGYLATPQLYNLATDPGETTNVRTTEPAQAEQMAALLAELRLPVTPADATLWYYLTTPKRENRYATHTASGLMGFTEPQGEASMWKLLRRTDGTFDLVNRASGLYLTTGQVKIPALQMPTSSIPPAAGWTLTTSGIMGCLYAISNGTSELNQAGSARNYMVLNWGNGTNVTDAGCLYAIVPAAAEPNPDGIVTPWLPEGEQQGGNGTDGAPISALYNLAGQRLSPTRQPAPGCYVVKTPSGSARTVYYRAR
ncbi:MAG: arylsulfatase [Bacteroidales bacterium]|nr:arylsulfatase [Bacteroidales bacterium]